jgi:hypothetical protein
VVDPHVFRVQVHVKISGLHLHPHSEAPEATPESEHVQLLPCECEWLKCIVLHIFVSHRHPQMLLGELSDAVPLASHEQFEAEQLLCGLENATV